LKIMVNLTALNQSPDEKAKHEAWVSEFGKAIEQSDKGSLCELPRGGGRGSGPRGLSGVRMGSPAPDQGQVRSDQPVPPESKYQP
jgi:hypothetical protein